VDRMEISSLIAAGSGSPTITSISVTRHKPVSPPMNENNRAGISTSLSKAKSLAGGCEPYHDEASQATNERHIDIDLLLGEYKSNGLFR
jgi:ADP-heptose:LPS heptosyltransferase